MTVPRCGLSGPGDQVRAWVGLLAVGLVLGVCTATTADAASQGAPCDAWAGACCDDDYNICDVGAEIPGEPEVSRGGSTGSGGSSAQGSSVSTVEDPVPVPDLCTTSVADPQPPVSDPVWEGHDDGLIMMMTCRHINEGLLITSYWTSTEEGTPSQAPTVTPAELAQRALSELAVPSPAVHRSPPETARSDGSPYTWINLPTWWWTSTDWEPLQRTARAGAVWARVTVEPDRMFVDGGDGGRIVSCDGPGRPYEADSADTVAAISRTVPADACTYTYSAVAEAVTASVSIEWAVTWEGSNGSGGSLPVMTTTTSQDPMAVLQIESVIMR